MYHAELMGKLPAAVEHREDILTSNVFSFFKYTCREIHLKELFALVGVAASPEALLKAEFSFWPNYDDGTQPDLVIRAGQHYLLFEMKLHSDVAEEDGNAAGQLIREISAGMKEAGQEGRQFRLILVTDDCLRPDDTLKSIPDERRRHVRWINWQSITHLLLRYLEKAEPQMPDYLFAGDLYRLMDSKHLRGFMSFGRLVGVFDGKADKPLFFSARSATFRGSFIGFTDALSASESASPAGWALFWGRRYFESLPAVARHVDATVFYGGGR